MAKMLKFKDKTGNRSKCWNFSAKWQIDQNVAIWVQKYESVKILKIKEKIANWS